MLHSIEEGLGSSFVEQRGEYKKAATRSDLAFKVVILGVGQGRPGRKNDEDERKRCRHD